MWSKFSFLFRRLAPLFSASVPGLVVVIFVLLQAALWWLGPQIEIDGYKPLVTVTQRMIASLIVCLIAFSIWGWLQSRKLRKVKAEQHYDQLLEVNPVQRFVDRQETELNQMMIKLKQSLNCRNYLYELPWYLVLGMENAGKTSLINRSGQSFVLSSVMRASGNKSENPFSFDWWVGDKAVLIDPDGELLAQKSSQQGDSEGLERNLWLHFVTWLDRKRSRRPLNGVVVALDLAHLVSSDAAERKAYAYLIRARLRELMETLSTRLPVYISLTKLDLLHGFEPLFREYSKEQRDEVLGFTFSLDSVQQFDSWLTEFDAEYDQFIARLNALLPSAMMHCRDTNEREAIYSLSRQLAGLKRILLQFFHDSFSSDQFSTSALVRGVYFTSVFQQGVPVNAFVDASAQRYGMAESINYAQKAESSTTYFTPNLFQKIIYPEAGLAGDNFKVAKQKRRIMMLSAVACSIAGVILLSTWVRYYHNNINSAEAVLTKVEVFHKQNNLMDIDPTGKNLIEPLNLIRSATLEFGVFRDKPKYISDLGLYQGHVIGPKVEETYLNLLEFRYLPSLMAGVSKAMLEAPAGSDEKLALLRVFRMLTDKSGRHDEVVKAYFAQYWQQIYAGNRDVQMQLMSHLEYALEHTDLTADRLANIVDAENALAPYDQTVLAAQKELSKLPMDRRLFRNLEQSAATDLGGTLNLRLAIGPSFDLVFDAVDEESIEIQRLMTKSGFNGYYVPKAAKASEFALIDSWVLGLDETLDFSDEDKRVLRAQVRDLYQQQYINSWDQALANVKVKKFEDINHAVLVLEQLVGSTKPLSRLLTTLSQNTSLFPALPDDEVAKKALMKSEQYQIAAEIANDFNKLNGLLVASGEQPAYIDEVSASIYALYEYMNDIQSASEQGKAALEATQKRISLSDADPIFALQRIAEGLPAPLNKTVRQIADDAWRVVLVAAVRQLEVVWYEEVYQAFEAKLANKYPFNPNATKDVALDDFAEFFAPNGVLNTFYDNKLSIFLEDPNGANPAWAGGQNLIRSDVLAKMQTAKHIQQAFFNKKGSLDVEFTLEPLELSPDKRRSLFNVDGQYVEYSHGPRMSTGLVWPNTLRPSATSKVTLVPGAANKSPRSVSANGQWALFRLLDKGQVTGTTATSVDYEFKVDHGHMRYRLVTDNTVNPFTTSLLQSFTLPQTLY
ncbi:MULTISPECIES: type VI secretion system membrane subunit TssM [unclassified Motilimonas]|uniref:type VI secretion system membrane subunit TssM n=1 Tax=unclassified Motilimonas TaxID=2643697 RepID=UPI001E4ED48A|nr:MULTISPECIES: type VI secretion system membrane subunit TssM [unclassified Motilimonas]MCE0559228.1 type VI secretion system membrane subunit TssM [Motilimonas sp. E26]MDO6527511.1 type VI secretion system membrane subunit TssM [Motilimonas sp. 1_MG-2023]